MNITFLIGNGFDIGIGIKSRFKDFFPIYQHKSLKKEEKIKRLSEEISENYETWADFELALGEYTTKFDVETKKDYIDQIKDFEKEFIAYLKENEEKIKFEEKESVAKYIKKALTEYYFSENLDFESSEMLKELYKKKSIENHNYNFINFNYTSTLEKCLNTIPQKVVEKRKIGVVEVVDKIGKVIHIHGKCDNYPIIGVNDASQIANKVLKDDKNFTRYIVKPSINMFLRQGNDQNATRIINESTIICIYGMSLGETDKKWWELLVKWLNQSPSRQLIIFEYDKDYTMSTPFGRIEKEDLIMDKLKYYNAESNINVESLRQRIHIAVHKNIFGMSLPEEYYIDF